MMFYSEIYFYLSIFIFIFIRNVRIPYASKMLFMIPLLIILMEIDEMDLINKIVLLYLYLIVMGLANIIIY